MIKTAGLTTHIPSHKIQMSVALEGVGKFTIKCRNIV